MSIDLQQARCDTPGCTTVLHFNNAGAALMPRPVLDRASVHYYNSEEEVERFCTTLKLLLCGALTL